MSKKAIGILTWRDGKKFEEPRYLRQLVQTGRKLGAEVFLFSHQDIFPVNEKIRGFIPSGKGGWEGKWFSWPDIVIDRYRKYTKEYNDIRHGGLFFYANKPLAIKWIVTQLLANDEAIRRWIPQTVEYSSAKLREMLQIYPFVYIKPGNGTGGRSIMRVSKKDNGFRLVGRSKTRAKKMLSIASSTELISWMHTWVKEQRIRKGNFMIQQGLDLELLPKRTVDVRVLIQKDRYGEWGITGMGVRISERNSAISNLHGGGKAADFVEFMGKTFGTSKMRKIRKEIQQLAMLTAQTLEKHFGTLMELGLDIGVDKNGQIWLIEVNPKPGRELFKELGQDNIYEEAIRKPLQFALYLAEQNRLAELSIPTTEAVPVVAETPVAIEPIADAGEGRCEQSEEELVPPAGEEKEEKE
ncbi:hypothetical protein GCM10023228_24620 [Brevibacillus fulvus]